MGDLLPENLSSEDRIAFIVGQVYEQARRDAGQRKYSLTTDATTDVLNTPAWKQCRTIGKWFGEIGWAVKLELPTWQGYIRFVFERMKPTIPLPGQLKNKLLIRDYMQARGTKTDVKRKTKEELADLYRKVVRPDLVSTDNFLRRIGLL